MESTLMQSTSPKETAQAKAPQRPKEAAWPTTNKFTKHIKSVLGEEEKEDSLTDILKAKGADSQDLLESAEQEKAKSACQLLRNKCIQAIGTIVSASHEAYSKNDLESWAHIISDSELEKAGKTTWTEKEQALRENLSQYIPATLADVRKLVPDFQQKLATATAKKWISEASANRWRKNLMDSSVPWFQKKAYLTSTFNAYYANWEQIGVDTEKVKAMQKKLGVPDTQKELAFLKNSAFPDASYEEKRDTLDRAMGFLLAQEKGRGNLYKEAERQLDAAVRKGALSSTKVGTWLKRIFQSNSSPEKIQNFLSNKGNMPLEKLVEKWLQANQQYNNLRSEAEKLKQEKKELPRGFHFLTTAEFLNLHYAQRLAVISEAEQVLKNDIPKTVTPFNDYKMKIRHAFAVKDWEEAEELLVEARKVAEGNELLELYSMEEYLHSFQPTERETVDEITVQTPEQIQQKEVTGALEELNEAIALLPVSLQHLYISALKRGSGTVRCVTTLMYNRVWCHQHGDFLTHHKEQMLKERAQEETAERLRTGHNDGYENNQVTGFRSPAVREDGWGPQILHAGPESYDVIISKAEANKDNYAFWYWTTLLPAGVDYDTHFMVVTQLNYIFKKNSRILEKHGAHFSQTFSHQMAAAAARSPNPEFN